MCLYSTYVPNTMRRKARVGEPLTRSEYAGHVCFLADDGNVACIKPGTAVELTIKFIHEKVGHDLKQWVNKTVIVPIIQGMGAGFSADVLQMPNGTSIPIGWLAKGMQIRIPRKVRKDAGIKKPRNLDKVLGLDQIKADVPVKRNVTAQ